MFLLPVAAREVREASRQPRTYAWRAAAALITFFVMAVIAWVSRYDPSQGQSLFIGATTVAYLYCLLAGVLRTADVIAQEKRDNTLGLLFLTDLKGWDIILGKLLSSSVNCLFGLLALIPMLAIPMIMGGVLWNEFVRVVLSLLVTLLLSISWGFLISSLFRQTVVTISTGLAIVILSAGAIPMLALFCDVKLDLKTFCGYVFALSPTHAVMFAFDTSAPPYLPHYWLSLALNALVAFVNLRLAIFFLPRFWQEVPKDKKTERWRDRVRAWRFGKPKAKKRLRTRLLNQNPFFWLANREQVSSAGLLAVSAVILVIALCTGIAAAPTAWRVVEEMMVSWMIALALVHALIAFRMAMSASYRLAEDRRSGALELLLGTEISIRELLRGYWMALGRQFFGPAVIVFFGGFFAILMLLMLFSDAVHTGSIVETAIEIVRRVFTHAADKESGLALFSVISIQLMLALNWVALIWVGMWLGLREKRPGVATWMTLSTVFVPPWVLLIVGIICFAEMGLSRGIQPDEAMTTVLIAGWILGGSHVAILSWWARRNLITRFREAAADRYMGPRRIAWPRVRRVAIRFAAAGASVLLLLYSIRFAIDRSGNRAWSAVLAAHPNFKLEPTHPTKSVPADQNLANAPLIKSFSKRGAAAINWNLTSSVGRGGYNGEPLVWDWPQRHRMNLPRIADVYLERKIVKEPRETPAATVLEGLANYDEELAELRREASARPLLQFESWKIPAQPSFIGYGVYYAQPLDLPQPIQRLVQTLALRTSAQIANGSPDTSDLFLALRLAEGIKDIPQSLNQFHATTLDCVQPIYDGLAARVWKNDELQKIQDYFASHDFFGAFDAYRENYLRQVVRESEAVVKALRSKGPSHQPWVARQAPIGFRRKWEADTLTWGLDTLPKIVDTKAHHVDAAALHTLEITRPAPPTGRWFPDEMVVTIRGMAFMQTVADQITVACAIERYRNDHATLPKTLEELTPTYLAKIPHDVFTGAPLRYVLNADQKNYTIYAVGLDGVDDKGVPEPLAGPWLLQREQIGTDWVWNSAATDAPNATRSKTKKKK